MLDLIYRIDPAAPAAPTPATAADARHRLEQGNRDFAHLVEADPKARSPERVITLNADALGLAHDGDRQLAIVGVPDAVKGETLILLAAIDLDPSELRAKLAAAGVPNLWIPRTVRRVERIPILGSGKLDLGACKELALQAAE